MAQNGRFINIINELEYMPRWEEHAPWFEDNTAIHSFRTAVWVYLCCLVHNKKFGGSADTLRAVCRALFHDVNEIKTGTIRHETKKHPKVHDRIKKLEHKASVEINSYLSHSLQAIFEDFIVHAEDGAIEGKIVREMDTLDAYLFCLREVEYGIPVFFPTTCQALEQQLLRSELPAVRWMMNEIKGKTPFSDLIKTVMEFQQVKRWKGKRSFVSDNDSVHSFRVACLAVFNAYTEIVKYDKNIDVLRVVLESLFHDLVEQRTGDVLGPVKHQDAETKNAFAEFEKEVAMDMVSEMAPDFMQSEFIEYMVNAKGDTYEGYLVGIADKLDALFKANMERHLNIKYEKSYWELLRKIQAAYDNPSTLRFLAYILPDQDDMAYDESK